jgi:pyrroline-5-carboxylate reductase
VLTDNVCSPGGSTIEGVKSFRKDDLDAVTQRALKAAYDRTLELSR